MKKKWMLVLVLVLVLLVGCGEHQVEEPSADGKFAALINRIEKMMEREDREYPLSFDVCYANAFYVGTEKPMETVELMGCVRNFNEDSKDFPVLAGDAMQLMMKVELHDESGRLEDEVFLSRLKPSMEAYASAIDGDSEKLMEAVKLIRQTKRDEENPEAYEYFSAREKLSPEVDEYVKDMNFFGYETDASSLTGILEESSALKGHVESFKWMKFMETKSLQQGQRDLLTKMDHLLAEFKELRGEELSGERISVDLTHEDFPYDDCIALTRTWEMPVRGEEKICLYGVHGAIFEKDNPKGSKIELDDESLQSCIAVFCQSLPEEYRYLGGLMWSEGIVPYRDEDYGEDEDFAKTLLDEEEAKLTVHYTPGKGLFHINFTCGLDEEGKVTAADLEQYLDHHKQDL